ncbi:hypothetical protein BGZ65_003309 [Modicella reniformis]|uniref:Uncharacterized protein n=1 Tax=Modicella reniformis TaxID=1440133 RepID=A0A9P6IKP0_9FUNG|nr:hypothetical protein BGZ65_003309 [Modicella reniformis]
MTAVLQGYQGISIQSAYILNNKPWQTHRVSAITRRNLGRIIKRLNAQHGKEADDNQAEDQTQERNQDEQAEIDVMTNAGELPALPNWMMNKHNFSEWAQANLPKVAGLDIVVSPYPPEAISEPDDNGTREDVQLVFEALLETAETDKEREKRLRTDAENNYMWMVVKDL